MRAERTVRVTPSARDELLETLVRLRQRDREEAALFVERVEDRLTALAAGDEDAAELGSPWRAAHATGGHRLYVRERKDDLWLIAVWPEEGVSGWGDEGGPGGRGSSMAP